MIESSISIIGKIASGKSTIAIELGKKLGLPVASFGGYLTAYSTSQNLPTDRESLQNLGARLLLEQPAMLLENTINYFANQSNTLIIEGIRHLVIRDLLKKNCPNSIFFFIDAHPELRYRRYIDRRKPSDIFLSLEDFLKIDDHSVEKEINALKNDCQIINSEVMGIAEIVAYIEAQFINSKTHLK